MLKAIGYHRWIIESYRKIDKMEIKKANYSVLFNIILAGRYFQ